MDGENVPYVIVSDVVIFLDLHIRKNICQPIFMKVHISDIHDGSSGVTMGRSPACVYIDGFVYGLDVYEERAVAKCMHCAMVVKENPVWVHAFSFILHVMGYLVEARAWRRIGVIVVFVARIGAVFCFSVAFIHYMFYVHA